MSVKRIVPHLEAANTDAMIRFYSEVFRLDVAMQFDWITTMANGAQGPVQLSITSSSGSDGVPVPALTMEVMDVDAVFARAQAAGATILHPLTDEDWGVRRFILRDPADHVVNVMMHQG